MGSDVSHFNISLIVQGSHETASINLNFSRERWADAENREQSFRLPARAHGSDKNTFSFSLLEHSSLLHPLLTPLYLCLLTIQLFTHHLCLPTIHPSLVFSDDSSTPDQLCESSSTPDNTCALWPFIHSLVPVLLRQSFKVKAFQGVSWCLRTFSVLHWMLHHRHPSSFSCWPAEKEKAMPCDSRSKLNYACSNPETSITDYHVTETNKMWSYSDQIGLTFALCQSNPAPPPPALHFLNQLKALYKVQTEGWNRKAAWHCAINNTVSCLFYPLTHWRLAGAYAPAL